MNANLRQLLQLLLIVLLFTAACAWLAPLPLNGVVWVLRLAPPAVSLCIAWVLFRAGPEPERIPDLLREVTGGRKYFERHGFCFAPVVETVAGRCVLSIFFQNRYAHPVKATVAMRPPLKSFRITRHGVAPVSISVDCPGAAFGVVRVAYPVPAGYRGRRMRFDVGADVKYPRRRGPLLRKRMGVRVGPARELRASYNVLSAFGTLILLCCGVLYVSGPAGATLVFPADADEPAPGSEKLPVGAASQTQILWLPDAPGALPAVPARAAA